MHIMCLDIINILDILRILDWGWLATCSDFDGGGAEGAPPCRSRIISWVSKASKNGYSKAVTKLKL
jgi:hypothetical protein